MNLVLLTYGLISIIYALSILSFSFLSFYTNGTMIFHYHYYFFLSKFFSISRDKVPLLQAPPEIVGLAHFIHLRHQLNWKLSLNPYNLDYFHFGFFFQTRKWSSFSSNSFQCILNFCTKQIFKSAKFLNKPLFLQKNIERSNFTFWIVQK